MLRMRSWMMLKVVWMAALAWTFVPAAHVSTQGSFDPWLGTYENVSMDGSKETIETAIERGTESMGFLRQKVARSRLRAINPPYHLVRIVEDGDHLITDFDGRKYRAPLDGSMEKGIDPEGKEVEVSYRPDGNTLRARYVAEDGEKRMDFERSNDGSELVLHVTVLSPKLPGPIKYDVHYRRR